MTRTLGVLVLVLTLAAPLAAQDWPGQDVPGQTPGAPGNLIGSIQHATDHEVTGEIHDPANPDRKPAIVARFHGLNVDIVPLDSDYTAGQFKIVPDYQVGDYDRQFGPQPVDLLAQTSTGEWVRVDTTLLELDAGSTTAGAGPSSGPTSLPGSLMGGDQPAPPPVNTLPVSPELADRAAGIATTYGLDGVYGPDTTSAHLDVLERALAYYPPGVTKGLSVNFEPAMQIDHPGIAAWWDWSGQIDVFDPNIVRTAMVHEIAHHLTLMSDRAFGQDLAQGLGWTRTDASTDAYSTIEAQGFAGDAVAATAHPTQYSYTDLDEHLAEVVEHFLVGDADTNGDGYPTLSDYRCPDAAAKVLTARLGAGAADGLTGGAAL